jgi:hypothetical protein
VWFHDPGFSRGGELKFEIPAIDERKIRELKIS